MQMNSDLGENLEDLYWERECQRSCSQSANSVLGGNLGDLHQQGDRRAARHQTLKKLCSGGKSGRPANRPPPPAESTGPVTVYHAATAGVTGSASS